MLLDADADPLASQHNGDDGARAQLQPRVRAGEPLWCVSAALMFAVVTGAADSCRQLLAKIKPAEVHSTRPSLAVRAFTRACCRYLGGCYCRAVLQIRLLFS